MVHKLINGIVLIFLIGFASPSCSRADITYSGGVTFVGGLDYAVGDDVTPTLGMNLILTVGDSITRGVKGSSGVDANLGYRKYLQDRLGAFVYDFVGQYADPVSSGSYDVNHAGKDGDYTLGILTRLLTNMDLYMRTGLIGSNSFVLLMAGTNDITHCAKFPCTDAELDAAVANVALMVDGVFARNAAVKMVVAKVTPRQSIHSQTNVVNYNKKLSTMLLAKQQVYPRLFVVDMYAKFMDVANCNPAPDSCMADDNHPNNRGYKLMGDTFYNEIILHLSQSERTLFFAKSPPRMIFPNGAYYNDN